MNNTISPPKKIKNNKYENQAVLLYSQIIIDRFNLCTKIVSIIAIGLDNDVIKIPNLKVNIKNIVIQNVV